MSSDRHTKPPDPGLVGPHHLIQLLADWLPHQRWFAGQVQADALRVESRVVVVSGFDLDGAPVTVEHVVLSTDPTSAAPPHYQLFIGYRHQLPDRLAHSAIGSLTTDLGTVESYDAVHDSVLSSLLIAALPQTPIGSLTWRDGVARAELTAEAQSGLVISAEQSNTSIVFGDVAILKLFRRLEPGRNPDAEIHTALAEQSSDHVAPVYGELVGEIAGVPTTIGLLTGFFANSADGWQMATGSVRDLMAEGDLRAAEVGGDFAAESRRLGAAVAAVHAELATAFGTTIIHAEQFHSTIAQMQTAAIDTAAQVPTLAPYSAAIAAVFDQARDSAASLTLQRIHGDLHLGQVLRTVNGWSVIDFEGEPSKTLAHRRAMHSPLRDVAGMLRSFDYAAQHLLAAGQQDAQHEYRAREWAARNRRAFCHGYAEQHGTDPRHADQLMRAFELDKAVYEVLYEHHHRPSWLPIPLHAVSQLTHQGGPS